MSEDFSPPSGSKRFFRMARLTASMAGRYAGHAVANRFRDDEARLKARQALQHQAGEDLAATLGELKGAMMKLGQFASQTAELLPQSIAEPLKALQNQAPPLPFALAKRQLELSLGDQLSNLYAHFEEEAYAAASIGQVHRARLHDGTDVVVKLQYPGVAASCDSDLRQFKRALRAGRLLQISRTSLDEIFEEIRQRLHEELDYRQEAQNMRLFRDFFASDAGIVIPQVVDELSNAKVLTMQLESGDSLDTLDKKYDQGLRNQLSLRLFHFMCQSLFQLGHVHADPNPANFAYRADGTLVIYDFGCVKRLEPDLIDAYRSTVRAGMQQDWPAVDAGLHRLGARIPNSPPVEDEFYAQWQKIVLQPFMDKQAFNFAESRLHRRVMAKSPEMLQRLQQFQPPAQTLYLDRMVGGHYWTLVSLGGQLHLGRELQSYLD